MKRAMLAVTAALSIIGALKAQSNLLLDNPENESYLGIRLGFDVSSTAGCIDDTYGNGAGFTLGAVYNIPLWQNLYFEPGLHLFYDTFDYDLSLPGLREDLFTVYEGSIRNFGFRIPFNVGYHFDFTDDISVSLFTGPVLNTNITAKTHVNGLKDYSYSIMENGFKRFDMQWDFGVSMSYGHNYYVAISGAVGMTKAYNPGKGDLNFRRNTCNIAVGYNF